MPNDQVKFATYTRDSATGRTNITATSCIINPRPST